MSVSWQHTIKLSILICKECESKFPIPRNKGSLREKNHVKDLWCYRCHKVTKHLENIT